MTKKKADSAEPIPFNPWTAPFEEAIRLQETWAGSRGGPVFQHVAAHAVTALRASVQRGDGTAVLAAVAHCALEDLVMPEWLAKEYLRRFRLVTHAYVPTWGDAFGEPWPKGIKRSHLARRRQRTLARVHVWNLVNDFVQMHPDAPLDPEWDRIAREAGVGRSLAQDLYYKHPMGPLAPDVRERMGWPRVPSKTRKLAGRPPRR